MLVGGEARSGQQRRRADGSDVGCRVVWQLDSPHMRAFRVSGLGRISETQQREGTLVGGRSSGKSPRFPCSFWGRNGVRWVVGGAGANFAPSGTCSKHHAHFPIRRALVHSAPSRSPRSRCCTWRGGAWLLWTRGCRILIWGLRIIPQASEPRLGPSRCRFYRLSHHYCRRRRQ